MGCWGHGQARGHECPELVGQLDALGQAQAGERLADVEHLAVFVETTVVVGGEGGFLRELAGQQATGQRQPHDDGHTLVPGPLEEHVDGLLAEEAEDNLEGREILLLAVADETGISSLARLKAATAALADPRKTDPQRAEEIIAGARPIYFINAGLHGDETGEPEAVLELAYRLAVSEQPMIRRIREHVVVLINPVASPDGRAKMADWFYRYLKGRTDYESLPRQSPPYWGHYVFVDANRDRFHLT